MPTPTPYQESPPATLPAPSPTQPVAGRPVEADAPTFDWTPVPGATRYRVQIASTNAFDTLHYDETIDRGSAIPLDSALPDDVSAVYWRVRAEGADAEPSPWSDPAHFAAPTATPTDETQSVRVDASPVPIHPEGNRSAPVDQRAVPFSWEGIPEASGYQLQVAPSDEFETPPVNLTVDKTTSVTLYDELPRGGTSFYWRIRPLFRTDTGPWSDPVPFAVASSTEDDETPATEATDPPATARAAGPVVTARTSRTLSLTVSLLVVLSFLATIALILLVG